MKLPFSEPDPAGSERARIAKQIRDLATEVSRLQPQALSRSNSEEADHSDNYPANFTKGLYHNKWGILHNAPDYHCLVEAINSPDRTLFEKHIVSARNYMALNETGYICKRKSLDDEKVCCKPIPEEFQWRGWESPRQVMCMN